jgi:hypothetical protein
MRLIDADALLEKMEEWLDYLRWEYGEDHDYTDGYKEGYIAVEETPTVEIPRGEWISVEDRLPTESDGTVLVCMPDIWPYNHAEPFVNAKHDCRVRTAHYSEHSHDWTYDNGGRNREFRPTHWMPLPDPYIEKEN